MRLNIFYAFNKFKLRHQSSTNNTIPASQKIELIQREIFYWTLINWRMRIIIVVGIVWTLLLILLMMRLLTITLLIVVTSFFITLMRTLNVRSNFLWLHNRLFFLRLSLHRLSNYRFFYNCNRSYGLNAHRSYFL